ncbi:anaerobic sulfite reductase subunit AsrA [Desulfobacterium sp. N47]|uniref:Anaerobic sulfite reductase subunit A n=1 Tax=uncultured Desulfobacterium sp. TaxID=201089 RepID=E1YDJ3_9BACT|nr:Anaerobic sulfite reductase subunit A [uncultured Desulfobacterium sp.]
MGWKFTNTAFNNLFSRLAEDYTILAPKRFVKRGRFSDTDLIRYDEVKKPDDIVWKEKSTFSPKEAVFPVTQTLFYFTEEEFREPRPEAKQFLVFLRPCDINGIRRLDTIYIKNGPEPDSYYTDLRKRVRFVMIECAESFDNCFCVSMKSNTTSGYDMAVRLAGDNVLLEIKNDEFLSYITPDMPQVEFRPEFVMENKIKVNVPETNEIPAGIYNHDMWNEYKSRCIACGRCNTTCVTCTCHTTSDIFYDDNSLAGERRRTWASCHIDGFTDMAGGISFRKDNGSRMRFKVLHKIYDYNKRFGEHMCVGCGRCDDNCPEYISYSGCINKLNKLITEAVS